MPETPGWANIDYFPWMNLRRQFMNFAETRRDFYVEGMEQVTADLDLDESSLILDVGASNGQFIYDAARKVRYPGRIIALDPLLENYQEFAPERVRNADRAGNLAFVGGAAGDKENEDQTEEAEEGLPFPDDMFDAVSCHNTAHRAKDRARLYSELHRVTKPKGLIVMSTNELDHAIHRHRIEHEVNTVVCGKLKIEPIDLKPPAEHTYVDDMEEDTRDMWGLSPAYEESHDARARITPARLKKYRKQIYTAFYATNIPREPENYILWRNVTNRMLKAEVVPDIERQGFFADVVHRRMLIYVKPALALAA